MEIVSALRVALADRVGKERFSLWFGASTRLELDDHRLLIVVPNRFFVDWMRSSFRRHIEGACSDLLGRCPAIRFEVDPTLSEAGGESMRCVQTNGSTRRAAGTPANGVDRKHPAGESKPPCPAPSNGSTRPKFARLESFVVGQTNRLAAASAESVARQPGQMTPLLIHGPTGVGKTHLLQGICAAARATRTRPTAIYLSAEQFTTQFVEALRGSGLPNFRRKYRGLELLILDDLHFLAGKRATQIELLHTVDTFLREGRQLVFAADRAPNELDDLAPELTSRLDSGMVCRVEPPDHTTRLGIVAQMARRMQVDVAPDVQQYIASRLTNHARELSGAICRLQATSAAVGRPITLAMAEEALAEMIRQSGRAVGLADIERAVCHVFGVESRTLHESGKAKRTSHPRMLAMWLARKHTRAALSEIGNYFGRSHSTVVSAQKRVDRWMADGKPLELAQQSWDVEEAIRRVELRLRAG